MYVLRYSDTCSIGIAEFKKKSIGSTDNAPKFVRGFAVGVLEDQAHTIEAGVNSHLIDRFY